MTTHLDKLTIRGFKSIESLEDFPLGNLNVLIGANGSGKSNFVDFFRMLRALADEGFQEFVNGQGGGDGFFFLGPKVTRRISARLEFGSNAYEFELGPTAKGSLQIISESQQYANYSPRLTGSAAFESTLKANKDEKSRTNPKDHGVGYYVYEAIANWVVYHFHDTSPLARMRRDQFTRDWDRLHHDAGNIAAYLLQLQSTRSDTYELIRDTVRLIAPFFDDFLLRPVMKGNDELVRLEWKQKASDFPFQPHQLSDGTIRFVCLATTLLQPSPPATIVIDEPELGLHPYAISVLANLIQSAAERTQVIISTQSPSLLDHFTPEQIIVVNREKSRSVFHRLEATELTEWLDDYSIGELWQKNVVRGGPVGE